MYQEWKCFKDEYPISLCGLLIKIVIPDDANYLDDHWRLALNNHLFYGYVFENSDYIYLIYDITDSCGMAFKVLKEIDVEHIYWLYEYQFSKDWEKDQPERSKRENNEDDEYCECPREHKSLTYVRRCDKCGWNNNQRIY